MNPTLFAGQWENTSKGDASRPWPFTFNSFYRLAQCATPVTGNFLLNVEFVETTYLRVLLEIIVGESSITLALPVTVNMAKEEGGFSAENEDLTIFAGGSTEAEAIQEFQEFLLASWDGLKDVPAAQLTNDAQVLREKLSKHFAGA